MSLSICRNGHLTGAKKCYCGVFAGRVTLPRRPLQGPLTVETRSGRTRQVTVREFRALHRQKMKGGPFSQKDVV
jgi:hypothetical protein